MGSTNFDARSLALNEEIGVGLLDRDIALQLKAAFERDLQSCREWTLEDWHAPADARPIVRRIRLPAARSTMSVTLVQSLKKNWRELADSPPGKRFRSRYERSATRSGGKRTLTLIAASLLIAAGVVLLVIPGPGSVLIVLGAALLAEASLSVARWLDWAELRIRKLLGRSRR